MEVEKEKVIDMLPITSRGDSSRTKGDRKEF